MARKEIYDNGNPLRVVTLCSGYDSQCLALNRLGIPYELVAWSEIDKYAIQAHDAVFPEYKDRNFGDICKIDWGGKFQTLTYSHTHSLALTFLMPVASRDWKKVPALVVPFYGNAGKQSRQSTRSSF